MKMSLFALVACARLGLANEAASLPPDAQADFAWFDTLGFPDLHGCPVVHVATGEYVTFVDGSRNSYTDGFLLSRGDQGRFQVLAVSSFDRDRFDNLVSNLVETPPGTPEYKRIGYEASTLQAAVDACFKPSTEPISPQRLSDFPFLKYESGEILRRFFWAWACWRNGLDQQASALYADIPPSLRSQDYNKRDDPPVTVRAVLEENFGRLLLGKALRELGDPQIPRERLIDSLRRVGQLCPASRHAVEAKQLAETLRAMIAEDATHLPPSTAPLADSSPSETARELVYRLREQSLPRSMDSYLFRSTLDPVSPAGQLVALHLEAVPALLDVLDDSRPTRCCQISFSLKGYLYDSCVPVSIGDFALRILEEVAGRRFVSTSDGSPGGPQSARTAARKWWAAVQEKGEPKVLVDAVLAGNPDCMGQVRLLIERYPAVIASDPVIQAVVASPKKKIIEEEAEEEAAQPLVAP